MDCNIITSELMNSFLLNANDGALLKTLSLRYTMVPNMLLDLFSLRNIVIYQKRKLLSIGQTEYCPPERFVFLIPVDELLQSYWVSFFENASYDPIAKLKECTHFVDGIHYVLDESLQLTHICIYSFLEILSAVSQHDGRFRTKHGMDIDYTYSATENYFEALKHFAVEMSVASYDFKIGFVSRNDCVICSLKKLTTEQVTKLLGDIVDVRHEFFNTARLITPVQMSSLHLEYSGDLVFHEQFLTFKRCTGFLAHSLQRKTTVLVIYDNEDKSMEDDDYAFDTYQEVCLEASESVGDVKSKIDLADGFAITNLILYDSRDSDVTVATLADTLMMHEICFGEYDTNKSFVIYASK